MKAYFLARQLREKILIIGLTAAGLVVWTNHLMGANHDYRDDMGKTLNARKKQEDTLNREAEIYAQQRAIVEKFSSTASSIRDEASFDIAMAEVAREAGITTPPRGSKATTAKASQITIITKEYLFTDLDPSMSDLIPLYRKMGAKAPYINIVTTYLSLTNNNGRGGRGAGGAGGGGFGGGPGGGGGFGGGGGAGGGPGGGGGFAGGGGGGANPGGGGRGARGTQPGTGTIGTLDLNTPGTAVGRGRNNNQQIQPTGPRLNATFSLTAISINNSAPATRGGGRSASPAPAPAAGARGN